MIQDLDFVLYSSNTDFMSIRSHYPTAGISGNYFTRRVIEMHSGGLFLVVVVFDIVDDVVGGAGMAEYNRYKSKSTLNVIVKNEAGDVEDDRVYPENVVFQCESLHTHTVTDGSVKGINGFTTAFRTAYDVGPSANRNHGMQSYFFVDLKNRDRLIVYRDDVPDTDCRVSLFRLAPFWHYTGEVEI
jgi:hypothetical protein